MEKSFMKTVQWNKKFKKKLVTIKSGHPGTGKNFPQHSQSPYLSHDVVVVDVFNQTWSEDSSCWQNKSCNIR